VGSHLLHLANFDVVSEQLGDLDLGTPGDSVVCEFEEEAASLSVNIVVWDLAITAAEVC